MSRQVMEHVLETERLILLPLQFADAERSQELFAHWEIVRFMSTNIPWPYPQDGAVTYYRDVALPAIGRGDEWHWTLRLKTSPDRHIGAISLSKDQQLQRDNRGFWLGAAWHGKGLMTEAVIAANDYWFDVLGFSVLRVSKAIANSASRRISQKTGMRVISTSERDYVSGRLLSEVWEITASEWREKRKTLLLTNAQ